MCFYNRQKAFDSVIFPVLFHRLYNVRGEWEVLKADKNWYEGDKLTSGQDAG